MNNDLVIIELDKSRELKFRRKELKILEKVLNAKISKINFSDFGIEELTKVIHTGLLHEDPSLTLEQIEELIDNSTMTFGELSAASMDAFSISMGGKKRVKEVIEGDEAQPEIKN